MVHVTDHSALLFSTVGVLLSSLFKPLAAPILPALLVFSGAEVWTRAYDSVVRKEGITQQVLDALVLGLLVLHGEAATAIVSVWFGTVADTLRRLATTHSTAALRALLPTGPVQVWVRRDHERVQQHLHDLTTGSTIVLYPGDRLPVEGTVIDGSGTVYEHVGHGREERRLKESGDPVHSGSFVADGHLYVVVNRVGRETAQEAVMRRAFARRSHETDLQQALVESAERFRPFAVAGAGVAALIRGGRQATTVLMIDYESGIKIAAPTAIIVAMLRAAAHGIIVQDGRGLETLGGTDTLVCTLAGPVLFGRPEVTDIKTYESADEATVLAWAASAEARFGHGIAHAIVEAAGQRKIAIPLRSQVDARLGGGVRAVVEDHVIHVGTLHFLQSSDVNVPQGVIRDLEGVVSEGRLAVPVAVDGRVLALCIMTDRLRPEVPEVMAALQSRVGDVRLLTGGDQRRARAIADQLHLDSVVTANGPREKARLIHDLRRSGRTVAVLGHSAADAEAVAAASIGLTLSTASPVTRHLAHLVLSQGLSALPLAYDLSRETRRVMVQDRNLLVAANTAAIALTALGWLSPRMTSWLTDGSTLLATLNSARPILSNHHSPMAVKPVSR
jgi:Cu2+-exporting ATPase